MLLFLLANSTSFPFNGAGGFVRDIVDDPVDVSFEGVGDFRTDPGQNIMGYWGVSGGHTV